MLMVEAVRWVFHIQVSLARLTASAHASGALNLGRVAVEAVVQILDRARINQKQRYLHVKRLTYFYTCLDEDVTGVRL